MKISCNWLREFVDFQQSPEELGALLDRLGLEVDSLTEIGAGWSGVVVGRVIRCEAVSKTVHLSHCLVDTGSGENISVVCGAPNVAVGQVVPVALEGARMPDGFRITRRNIHGVDSNGMICSERELALSDEGAGIMVLPGDLPIGTPLSDHLGKHDWIFDLEVTFNRPDCLSHLGVAREIAAACGLKLKMPDSKVVENDQSPAGEKISVEILTAEKCPRYSARLVEGVEIKPSPLWMQERLRAVGVRPINNVVDVTNYILMEIGHPLHAFDYHLVTEGRIIVRFAENGEKFTTLDEKEHTLADTDLLISDPSCGVALAGVMGGLNSEIKQDTTDILLECACFEQVGIRVTSRDREISSESSHRFERGVDPEMTIFAINRSARLIKELGGGSIAKGIVDNYPLPWQQKTVSVRPKRVNAVLATAIDDCTMAGYLEALGCVTDYIVTREPEASRVSKANQINVKPPSWRLDLAREIDLIEEIARLYGYDNIATSTHSAVPLVYDFERERERRLIDRFKDALLELGMNEAISFPLIPAAEFAAFPAGVDAARILNPLSEDMSVLRPCLGPSLLRAVERNSRAGAENIRLFEWGNCFWMESGLIREGRRLGGVITGNTRPESWTEIPRRLDFFELKGLIEQLIKKISLDNVRFIYYHIPEFLEIGGLIATETGSETLQIGYFGKMAPKVSTNYNIDFPVWYFELNGDLLLDSSGSEVRFTPLPRYPAALRDLAFIVDDAVEAGRLEKIIADNAGELLEKVELFDLFKGGSISSGKKSLAFHLIYRSSTRTLSDNEVDLSVERVISALEEEVGAALRTL